VVELSKVVYSGKAGESQAYFHKIGCDCPPGFNIADYLIDLTSRRRSCPGRSANRSGG
jgi:hypothetical protein